MPKIIRITSDFTESYIWVLSVVMRENIQVHAVCVKWVARSAWSASCTHHGRFENQHCATTQASELRAKIESTNILKLCFRSDTATKHMWACLFCCVGRGHKALPQPVATKATGANLFYIFLNFGSSQQKWTE